MELYQRSMCSDSNDYENLLANLSVVKSLLECDASGNVPVNAPATQILLNMFRDDVKTPANNGFWKDCFLSREIYYYDKTCSFQSEPWSPTVDGCEKGGINSACNPTDALATNDTLGVFTLTVPQQGQIYDPTSYNLDILPETTQIDLTFVGTADTDITVTAEPTYLTFYAQCGNRNIVVWFEDSNVAEQNEPAAAVAADYSTSIDIWDGAAYKVASVLVDEITTYLDTTLAAGALFTNVVGGGTSTQTIDSVQPVAEKTTFVDIMNDLSCYLGNLDGNQSLEDVLKVVVAVCGILRKRITVDRIMNKAMLTINKCDL